MTKSNKPTNGSAPLPTWLRRGHRWLGIVTALFLLLLSLTGIALNHGNDWHLDERYVQWDWVLDAYGIAAPEPAASFADRGRRATQLGARLYLDDNAVPRDIDTLTGFVLTDTLAVAATRHGVLLLTADGDLVEALDLSGTLRGPITRLGRSGNRPVIDSGGHYLAANDDVSAFLPWPDGNPAEVAWSSATALPDAQRDALARHFRGRGLTLERLLLDVHSGRIVTVAGKALLDALALALIVLSVTGLLLWTRRGNRRNGGNGNNGQRR